MTDTARTVAELKALLADNTSQAISAQDMRDVVESVANPIAGGGLNRPIIAATRWADTDNYTVPGPMKFASGAGNSYDPEGWFTDEAPYEATWQGVTVPQGGLMRLPPGWYDAYIFVSIGPPIGSTSALGAALLHADDPTTLDPIWGGDFGSLWDSKVQGAGPPTGTNDNTVHSSIRVPSFDLSGNPVSSWPVYVQTFLTNQSTPGRYGQIIIRRTGDA